MPTYLDPLNGVSLSVALAEAAAIAPITRVMIPTYELRHPSLATPVRVAANHEDVLATLEDDAPEDASTEVEFLACAVSIGRPEESDTAASPSISLTINNVSGLMSDALRTARGSAVPWELTERVYASDDTSAPAVLPVLTLTMTSAEIDGTTVVLTCSYGDPANLSVPAITFTPAEYPGLAAR